AALLQLAQQLETVARAEHVVDDGEVVERRGGEFGERRFVRRRNLDFGVRPLPARAQELHHHLRVLDRIVDEEQTSHDRRGRLAGDRATAARWFGIMWSAPTKYTRNPPTQAAEEAFDRTRGALLQRAAMDRTELRRDRIAVLEVLSVCRASL